MKTANIEVTLLDHMGTDLSVVNAARVSFDKESDWDYGQVDVDPYADPMLSEQDAKLIRYLAKHKHTSPFNHCFVSFRVKAPIFVARQLVKHKFLPWNEVSRRYVDAEPEFFVPVWRNRADSVKQGSGGALNESEQGYINDGLADVTENALYTYKQLLEDGVCPEQARMVLPLNTMTEWVWSGSLGAFADMCRLRLDPHAQAESREVAEGVAQHLRSLYPVSFNALMENQ